MFGGRTEKSEGRKRRGNKRKAANVDESADGESIRSGSCGSSKIGEDDEKIGCVVDDLNESASMEQESGDGSLLPLCGLEDDERMLSFLQSNHRGDFQRAKLSAMVNVDRGYGKTNFDALVSSVVSV